MIRLAWLLALVPPAVALADGPRKGDEILIRGQPFPTGAPVVTWHDPGGYDASSHELRFPDEAPAGTPRTVKPTLGFRKAAKVAPETLARAQKDGWELPALREAVDQFVIHYDVCGTSRRCFRVLHDERGLSVHFMLDLDGTIYQTADLEEATWHATKANSRSIGIEIANMGAVPKAEAKAHFAPWYKTVGGETRITIPGPADRTGIRDRTAVLKPSRPEPIVGTIQGQTLEQYDLTDRQYDSLIKLTAALHRAFPKIKLDAPRGPDGAVIDRVLTPAEYDGYQGVLGHYHVQANKTDPGPAFRWDKVLDGARAIGPKP